MPISDVRILIVDDFESWRFYVGELLATRFEWKIVGRASDGLEAIQKAGDLRPDLILLDIGLPKLGGIEVSRRIREKGPVSKILFVSQADDPDVVRAALEVGEGYVLKTDASRELLPAIEAVLRGGRFISRSLAQ